MFSYDRRNAVKIIYITTENSISQDTSADIDLYRVAIERIDHAFHVTLIDRLSKPRFWKISDTILPNGIKVKLSILQLIQRSVLSTTPHNRQQFNEELQ